MTGPVELSDGAEMVFEPSSMSCVTCGGQRIEIRVGWAGIEALVRFYAVLDAHVLQLKRQNADLQAENTRLLDRARAAEAALEGGRPE